RKPSLPRTLRRSMLDQDGGDHRRLRTLVSKFFSPTRLAALRPKIERVADDLLAGLPVGEPVDLVDRFARPLPGALLAGILGVPEWAWSEFPKWETAILTAPSKAETEAAGRSLQEFALQVIELKQREPADDLYTYVVQAEQDGAMVRSETISMITLLLI